MNLKELTQPDLKQNSVSDHSVVLNDNQKILKDKHNSRSEHEGVNASSVQVDVSPIWAKVADRIDLKNATGEEVATLSDALFNAGAITFEDHINLSFQKNQNDEGPTDYIAYWQTEQENAIHHGAHHEDLNDIIRIQSILGYVDSLSR
mgnify:FL=1